MAKTHETHWSILVILALAQFMVVLDVSIVNVALPAIQSAFHLSTTSLQWIITAYTLMFGGCLLLGGRAADLYGRRRVFMIGTILFATASLVDALAQTGSMLIISRGVQGLSGALMSPAALSIVLVTYREGHGRNRALAVWGAVASGGAAVGVLLGGIITQYLGWRWNFIINVPIGILVVLAAWHLVPRHDAEEGHKNGLDLPGAVFVTSALMLLVYGLVEAPTHGWTAHSTLGFLGGAAVLMVAFIVNELNAKHPLIPFTIFKIRNVVGADLTMLAVAGALFSVFFFCSLYLQTILGYSPVKTGLAFLAVPIAIAIVATNVPRVIQKIGFKPLLVVGPLVTASGLFLLAHVPVHGSYLHHVLPGLILMGLGMGATFVSAIIAATGGVPPQQSGLASGLLNTSQQVGGSLGLAVLSGVAASVTTRYLTTHFATGPGASLVKATAAVQGYHAGFYTAMAFAIAASLIAFVVIKQPKRLADVSAPVIAAH